MGVRRWPASPSPALALLLFAVLAVPSPARALDADGATGDRLRVGGPAVVRVTWTVRLGPVRSLVVESPIGRFEGAGGRTFGGLLRREGAVGSVVFPELVTVPADLVLAALEEGAPVVLRRRFDVLRSEGPPESVEARPLRLELLPPRLTVAVAPPRIVARSCEVTAAELRWTIGARDVAPLEVSSERGVLLAGGREVAAPGGRLSGRVVERLELPETLRLTPELAAAALARGGELEVRRRFTLRGGGFERSLEASVAVALVDGEVAVTVDPERAGVFVGRTVPLAVRWSAVGTASCLELISSEVRLEAPDGRLLGRLDRELRLRVGGSVAESVPIPPVLSRAALDLGTGEVAAVRDFAVVADPAPVASPGAVIRGAVRLSLTGAIGSELTVLRLALRFEDGEVFRRVPRGSSLRAVAEVTTTGSGPLRAVWELADPTSASAGTGFRPLELVERPLVAGGLTVVESPELPTERRGPYLLRLRVTAPAVGFEAPVLRYQVAGGWRPPSGERIPSSLPPPGADPPPVEERDPVEEREVIALSAGLGEAVALEALGLEVEERYQLGLRWPRADGERLVLSVLRLPRGVPAGEAVRQIRRRYPHLWIDVHDLYAPQGGSVEEGMTTAAARVELGWGEEQKRCGRRTKIGTLDLPEHGERLREIVAELLAGDVEVAPDRYLERFVGTDFIGAVGIAVALDRLIVGSGGRVGVVQLGFAGRSNLILRFLFQRAVPEHVVFVAPYHDRDPDRSYPASSERVHGVVAWDPARPTRLPDGDFFAAPKIVGCENSCAIPFVAASLWVLGAGEEGTPWQRWRGELERVPKRGRWIAAPRCQ